MDRKGFTLLELLLVVAILGVLLGLILMVPRPRKEKGQPGGGPKLRKKRDHQPRGPARPQDRGPAHLPQGTLRVTSDCMTGFGARPAAVTGCTVEWQGLDPKITLTLKGATHSTVIYEGATGLLSTLP